MAPIDYSLPAAVRQGLASHAHPSESDNNSDSDSAVALVVDRVAEGLVDLRADGIGDTFKLIFGRSPDVHHVPDRFADDLGRRQLPSALPRDHTAKECV